MKIQHFVPSNANAIVLICDQNYLPAARLVAHQLLCQPLINFDVLILTTGRSSQSEELQDSRLQILDMELNPQISSLPHSQRKSTATYARLGIDLLFGDMYRKILYLDCDVWIANRPIGHLFELDMHDYEVAAVRDAAEIIRPTASEWLDYKWRLGLPKTMKYFNSGVMLIDVKNFRRAKVGQRALRYLAEGEYRGAFHDQSALNAVLKGRWLELSPLWNWMFATRLEITEKYNPAIIHFIGSNKPWRDRKAKHAPKYRLEMEQYLSSIGYRSYVEAVPARAQWRRTFGNSAKRITAALIGDRWNNRIEAFMATERFDDVDQGIVSSTSALAPHPG